MGKLLNSIADWYTALTAVTSHNHLVTTLESHGSYLEDGWSELFCAVLCTTVVYSDAHIHIVYVGCINCSTINTFKKHLSSELESEAVKFKVCQLW